jgi:hypothetical protein
MQPNEMNQRNPSAAAPEYETEGVSTADVAAAANRGTSGAATGTRTDGGETLFPADQTGVFRTRWNDIQTGFVDEPRDAVKQADGLVAEVIQKLAASFAEERSKLEKQWDTGSNVSTEDLRLAVRRYRSFFDKLLSM